MYLVDNLLSVLRVVVIIYLIEIMNVFQVDFSVLLIRFHLNSTLGNFINSFKNPEYQGHFHRGQFDFKPLAIELTGRWGTDLTSFFNAVCSKARTLHGLNATRYGYFVSYWRSRISVSFTRSLAEQAVHTKLQIYRGSQANNPLEPVELAHAF